MRDPAALLEIYEFADFRLNVGERVLENVETGERISLPDRAFDTLCVLVANAGRLVGKDELLNRVWADSFVEENNLNKSIHAIRRSLGENNGGQKFIETVKKHGFRFVADVRKVEPQHSTLATAVELEANVRESQREAQLKEVGGAAASPVAESANGSPIPTDQNVPHVQRQLSVAAGTRRSGLRPRNVVWAAAVVAVVVVGSLAYRYYGPGSSSGGNTVPRLAVLPLKPVNSDVRDRGLELAIADSLILKLSESKGFGVSHLSSVRRYVDVDQDPVNAGHELGVEYVLASNYQISGGRIRVTSQLVDASTGITEQTFKSESASEDLFVIQDTIANEIGNALLARFGKPRSTYAWKRGTENEEAFNLYYEAFYLVDKNTRDDSAKAVELLGRAVLLDPNYAQAWALRAQAYCQFAHNGGGIPDEIFTIAQPMLDKALDLDAENATALMIKGVINRDYHWRFDEAHADFNRSIEIDPNNSNVHRLLAGLYYRERRFAEALERQKIAVSINPTSGSDRWFLGLYLIAAGQRDEGVANIRRAMEMDPSWRGSYDTLWQLYHREGEHAEAYANFMKAKEQFATKPDHMAQLRNAYARAGWSAVLREDLEQMKARDPKGAFSGAKFYIATLAALCGEHDTAFEYLEEALRYRLIGMSFIKVDPRLEPIRNDPRYRDILRRAGFSSGS
jgi:adenylate cyclase